MVEVKFTEQSIKDLHDIADYIGRDSFHYSGMLIQKLINRTDILEQFPKIGRIVPELKIRCIRELIEGNYRIIYRIVNKEIIHVLTFYHSRRKLQRTIIKKLIKKNR